MSGGTNAAPRPLLAVDAVSKDYKVKGAVHRVLDDVTVALAAGQVLGVVGESGSGKTTLGRIIAGFLEPTTGAVRVTTSGRDPRRAVQMIFQESVTALNPRLPAWKCVAEAVVGNGHIRRQDRERVMQFIEYVGLQPADAERRPSELSGGQRQRISIARALAAEPALLVCDEAVSALDVSVRATVLNLLNRVRRELDVAMVFISHDMAVVGHMADEVLVLSNGHVMEYGPTAEVLHNPRSDYTKKLVAATPRLERQNL